MANVVSESKFFAALQEFAKTRTNEKSYDERTRATKEIVYAGDKSPDAAITVQLSSAKNVRNAIVVTADTTADVLAKIRAQKPFAIVAELDSLPHKIYQNWCAEIVDSAAFVPSKMLATKFVSDVRGNATFRTVLRDKHLQQNLRAQITQYNRNYNRSSKNIADVISTDLNDVENYSAMVKAFTSKYGRESDANALKYSERRASEFVDFAQLKTQPKRILDFACGTGVLSYWFAKKWSSSGVYACDVRDIFNAEAKKSGRVDYRITGDDTPNLAKLFADVGSFDLIICSLAMHHFADIDNVAAQLAAITARGGYLLIMEHDCDTQEYACLLDIVHGMWANVLNKESPSIEEWQQTYFATYARKSDWTKLLEKIGYTFICAKNFSKNDPQQRYFALYQRT